MSDIFGRQAANITAPITADTGVLVWGGTIIASATNLSLAANQPVTLRRTIGNKNAVIIPGMPSCSMQMSRLLIPVDATTLFGLPGWQACFPASITVAFSTCSLGTGISFRLDGATVNSYVISAEAEGTTVLDQVSLSALQLSLA